MRGRWRLLVAAPILMAAMLAAQPGSTSAMRNRPSEEAVEAVDSAKAYIARHDLRSARVELLNAGKLAPDWPEVRLLLADVALGLFDPVTAQEQLQKAAELGVERRRYVHLLAHAQWMDGAPQKAIDTLTEGDVAAGNLPYAYRILGRAQMDVGDTVAAGESFDKGLAIAPNDSLLWTETARLRLVVANRGGAFDALDRALAIDPQNIRALELKGRLIRDRFGMVAALPWFERGLQIDPNDVPLLEEYGATLGEAGRYTDMLAQARKILQLDTKNAKAFFMQAVIAARAGQFGLARRLSERVGGAFGELPAPQMLRAVCDYELGNPNQAVEILQRLNAQNPRNESIAVLLARTLYKTGDQATAWQVVAPLAMRSDSGTYVQRLAARILEAQNDREGAAQFLDRAAFANAHAGAVVTAPMAGAQNNVPQIAAMLADNRIGEAGNAAAALLTGNQGVAQAQLIAGDVEWAGGNIPAALQAYERARALHFTRAVLLRLVNAYRASGNAEGASEALAAYVAYNPADNVSARLMGFDLMDRRQWAAALPWLLLVRSRTGLNDSALNANIARVLSEMGRHDDAVRMARLAYRADPASLMTTRTYGNVLLKAKRDMRSARALLRKASKLAPLDAAIGREYRAALAATG